MSAFLRIFWLQERRKEIRVRQRKEFCHASSKQLAIVSTSTPSRFDLNKGKDE